MLILVLLFTVSAAQDDFASYHVRNYLNHSVSPCENFYKHVYAMPENETVAKKSESYYLNLAQKLSSRSLNNPVMLDIEQARTTLECTFNSDDYSNLLRERCQSDFGCYFEEFVYFYNLYGILKKDDFVDDSLLYYSTHGNEINPKIQNTKSNEERIDECLYATSGMVESLYNVADVSEEFEAKVNVYTKMQDRLIILELLDKNKEKNIGLKLMQKLSEQMKGAILKRFQETFWMNKLNDFGFEMISQFARILDELNVQTDIDALDRNLTALRKINREATVRYFVHRQRSTGCDWFDIGHSFGTIASQSNVLLKSEYANEMFEEGFGVGFEYNAWNYVGGSKIHVKATTFYPLLVNSSEATQLAFTGDIIGHEIYHSFINDAFSKRSPEFRNEADCLKQHYKKMCQVFAEGECNSGDATFSEDGPDVEGLRAAFDLLKMKFPQRHLEGLEYPNLNITREQSFFYSAAMRSCGPIPETWNDVHSPDYIRVNGLVSQMTEFSDAFGCQAGDPLFAEPDGVCYLFGEKSTGMNRNPPPVEEETTEDEYEDEDEEA